MVIRRREKRRMVRVMRRRGGWREVRRKSRLRQHQGVISDLLFASGLR